METAEIKKIAWDEIDRHREQILQLGHSVFDEPEEGFREHKTAAKVEEAFRQCGIDVQSGLALTGVKGYLRIPALFIHILVPKLP